MMPSTSKLSFALLAVGVICMAGRLTAAPPVASPIPLETGSRWTYEGKIETALSGSATTLVTNISWVMEIIDSKKNSTAQAAIVRGFPDELPWYEPAQVPGFCVLLNFSNHVYQFKSPDEKQARSILQDALNEPGKFSARAHDDDELFTLPLARDKRWGGDTKREDGYYCWRVEEEKQDTLHIEGVASNQTATVFTLAYRSLPDHQLAEVVPGLGITRYVYVHHGTVATVDVHLVSFKHPH
jgi:hypothetical protein